MTKATEAGTISAEEEKKRYQTLTAREKQILSLIAKGLINKEVSERLGLSPRTIEVHRQKGLHKLGVQTVSELVRLLSHIEENALSLIFIRVLKYRSAQKFSYRISNLLRRAQMKKICIALVSALGLRSR